ncbi:MAG: 50S ribosomal protein L18 [Elusimicrobia bacterium RIFOXYB2_FULL_49_7]|nr:MAG: 50S ribosomal protein L18 [Elusimicrobia bacterium RIFOXYB2_FULL_49_7]
MKDASKRFALRKERVRKKIFGTGICPRLSVHRGHKHIYAQLIDDEKGATLVAVSTLAPELKSALKVTDTVAAAKAVGEMIASKALEKGIKKAVFDRGGYVYHGRVKALADAARQKGLEF